jgi:isoleucyl-tRNA synthetase
VSAEPPDYKATTNLPRTDFAMKANLPVREPTQVAAWEERGTYRKMLASAKSEPYVLHDGPPYANGHIHKGHMLNKVLKDFVGKYRSMVGQPCEIIPGWDCHGLPIELAVDKELGSKKREMDKVAIRQECRRYADKFIDIQREEFKRLGVFMDWDHPYTTMAFSYEARIVRELAKIVRAGGLYRGKKPVYWCINDRTALAEAEVEYEDHDSPSIYVAFPLDGGLERLLPSLGNRKIDLAIWTTTPWTLPANLAIAVHPTFQYLVYELRGRPTVVASDLLVPFLAAVAPDELAEGRRQIAGAALDATAIAHPERILGYLEGRSMEGLKYRHPLFDRVSPVILGDHVTLEAGTGLVHTAPGHGQDDYLVGRKYGLPPLAPVDAAGRFTTDAGPFAGKQVFQANPEVVAALVAAGALLNKPGEILRHSYPHCWRCKKPVIFRATDQWFISMDSSRLRERALEAVEQVAWIPPWGRDRMDAMLEKRPDWCISRQRAWGVPIPAFYCEGCGESLLDPAVLEGIADRFEKNGADIWFQLPASELLPNGQKCPKCGGGSFTKEEDILDVWFESGISWSAVLEARGLRVPADLYLEGSDQHRGWFQSALLTALAVGRDSAPFKTCLTHGFLVDSQGRKLSKSLGNDIDSDKFLKQNGAEIVRLWIAAEDYRNDISLSNEVIARVSEAYRKLRNTLRYGLSNLYDYDPARDRVPLESLPRLDRYVRARLHRWLEKARASYEAYEFHAVYRSAMELCSVELSALYFDVLKDRLYCSGARDLERRAAQTVLAEIVDVLCRTLAPILSFTCEEAYGHLPGHAESVFVAGLPRADGGAFDEPLERQMARLLTVRADVQGKLEQLRRDKVIGSSQEACVELWAEDHDLVAALRADHADLAALLIVSEVKLLEQRPADVEASPSGAQVRVRSASGNRCARCWTHAPDVGVEPPLCNRCRKVVLAAA